MKARTWITAVAGLGIAGTAFAQSSVTLYGLLDVGLNYQSNAGGKPLYNMTSGMLNGDRFGLLGREDLGGGLAAIFRLENGFDITNGKLGQGGLLFGRQAYVGLASRSYGTVTLGRQYDEIVEFVNPFAVANTWGGPALGHPGDVDQLAHTNRVNSSVKYVSPEFRGFTVGALYGIGGVPGDVSRNQVFSVGAGYRGGPLSAGVGYLNVRQPNVSFWGDSGAPAAVSNGVPGANFAGSPVTTGFASAHSLQAIAVGAQYQLGRATLGANYSNTQFRGLGDRSAGPVPAGGIGGTATFNTGEINFSWQATPAILLGAAYQYTRTSGVSGRTGASYNQAALGASYSLSKTTQLYAIGVYQKAGGTDSTGHDAVASIYNLSPSTKNHQAYARIGIQKRF
ncbi:porin [Burkholderia multivorans]|uniref:porin n=1 Tax=Burkholderia cepacia complex TaxID=87882 RepID=UPI0007573E4F|nr:MULTISPECIES: porin [Burkholderia cepacia complex]KVV26194.1 porin [Burkholderia multivorans]MDN8114888.1 porin [Burkholderia vietnamiensis]HDR9140949.1 porin [Burkholderia vietnamiensis]